MTTPHEIAIQVLQRDLDQCRRFAQELLAEKNLLNRQLEILASELKMSDEDKARLRQKASSVSP